MNIFKFARSENGEIALQAFVAAAALSILFAAGGQVYAQTSQQNLTVTVNTALTFTTLTNNFTSINPGTPTLATTTLNVTTNSTNGWFVTLSGDHKTAVQNNFVRIAASSTQITDQTEWINGAATTSAGNAVRIGSFVNSGDVFAFRVSASSTNGAAFYSSTWWGTADNYSVDNAATLWAGVASSTNSRTIGNAGVGSYSAATHINTVQYYLDVAASQPTGNYLAPVTYTATGN